jgi:hypothetical protein
MRVPDEYQKILINDTKRVGIIITCIILIYLSEAQILSIFNFNPLIDVVGC